MAGQSNAVGYGATESTETPSAQDAIDYNTVSGHVRDVRDPTGFNSYKAEFGSFIPKFVKDYVAATGHNVLIVKTAVGGTSQAQWESGDLLNTSITGINDAATWADGLGAIVELKGILWSQGERDASNINAGSQTKAAYKTSFTNMINTLRTTFGTDLHIFIARTGTQTGASDVGYQDIRDAQDELAAASSYVVMAHTNSVNFAAQSKMVDSLHYNTNGLDEIGAAFASSVAATAPTGIPLP